MTNMDQVREDLKRGQEQQKEYTSDGRLYGPEIRNIPMSFGDGTNPCDNIIRFCPSPQGSKVPYLEVKIHYNVAGVQGNTAFCNSIRNESCFICEHVKRLEKAGDVDSKNLASNMSAKPRVLWQGIKTDTREDVAEGIGQIFLSSTTHTMLLNLFIDTDIGDFTDLKTGRMLNVKRTGKEKKTKYQIVHKSRSAVPEQALEMMGNPPSWKEIIWFFTDAQMEAMCSGELIKHDENKKPEETTGDTESGVQEKPLAAPKKEVKEQPFQNKQKESADADWGY